MKSTSYGASATQTGLSSQATEPCFASPPDGLQSLARRCEEAEGRDRRLDGLIFAHLNASKRIIIGSEPGRFPQKAIYGTALDMLDMLEGDDRMAKDAAEYLGAPDYTASLDAAMTLVPEGIAGWAIYPNAAEVVLEPGHEAFSSIAATPALALCAAALLARMAARSDETTEIGSARRATAG